MNNPQAADRAKSQSKFDWLGWLVPAIYCMTLSPFAVAGSVRLVNMLLYPFGLGSYFVTFEAYSAEVALIRARAAAICLSMVAFAALIAAIYVKRSLLGLAVTLVAAWIATATFVGVEEFMGRGKSIEGTLRLATQQIAVAATCYWFGSLLGRPIATGSLRGALTIRRLLVATAIAAVALALLRRLTFLASLQIAGIAVVHGVAAMALLALSQARRSLELYIGIVAVAIGTSMWGPLLLRDGLPTVVQVYTEVVLFFGAGVWWRQLRRTTGGVSSVASC